MVQAKMAVTLEKDDNPTHGTELEDELADALAGEIQKEIDNEIILHFLVENGWIKVEYHFVNNIHAVGVYDWCEKTCQGAYRRLNSYFVFHDEKDAEWFILRWS